MSRGWVTLAATATASVSDTCGRRRTCVRPSLYLPTHKKGTGELLRDDTADRPSIRLSDSLLYGNERAMVAALSLQKGGFPVSPSFYTPHASWKLQIVPFWLAGWLPACLPALCLPRRAGQQPITSTAPL